VASQERLFSMELLSNISTNKCRYASCIALVTCVRFDISDHMSFSPSLNIKASGLLQVSPNILLLMQIMLFIDHKVIRPRVVVVCT
jgi:hypothetical protein